MEIQIKVKNEHGETTFSATALTVDSAIQELGRYERNLEKKADIENDTMRS